MAVCGTAARGVAEESSLTPVLSFLGRLHPIRYPIDSRRSDAVETAQKYPATKLSLHYDQTGIAVSEGKIRTSISRKVADRHRLRP
jgi:hypothetical protein